MHERAPEDCSEDRQLAAWESCDCALSSKFNANTRLKKTRAELRIDGVPPLSGDRDAFQGTNPVQIGGSMP
jgi:hypothetical protein